MTNAERVPDSLLNVLGVVYLHQRTADGGDLYLTQFGLTHARQLQVENWFEPAWFSAHRVKLEGTSAVFRLPSKPVDGVSLELVVKNCRVGEDVPIDTHTLREFINTEFNSPWEEFSLVMELRDGAYGPPERRIPTQEPLAIYMPPERMQDWQTGRSEDRINRIQNRHPGMALDILKQYKLIYAWIPGRNVVETFADLGVPRELVGELPWLLNRQVLGHMAEKGFLVADMKPVHIILRPDELATLAPLRGDHQAVLAAVIRLIEDRRYAVIDYELLLRTPAYDAEVLSRRRGSYLDEMRDRFRATVLPSWLRQSTIMDVPYVHGHVESTDGHLWVVGRNGRLFDYFLPERWRRTPAIRSTGQEDVFYTITKDHVHLVWKTSRVGEYARADDPLAAAVLERGYNSPFEEASISLALSDAGIAVTFVRAIYRTGSRRPDAPKDRRRFIAAAGQEDGSGGALLDDHHDYVTICGYYNGPDGWVAERKGPLCRPVSLRHAVVVDHLTEDEATRLMAALVGRMAQAGFDGSLLRWTDVLITIMPDGELLRTDDGQPEMRICDFKLIRRLPAE